MDLNLLTIPELKNIARENVSCKGHSAYKKRAELLAFIKKCSKKKPVVNKPTSPQNLKLMTVVELRALAKKHGCSGYYKLKKDELITFVKKCIKKSSQRPLQPIPQPLLQPLPQRPPVQPIPQPQRPPVQPMPTPQPQRPRPPVQPMPQPQRPPQAERPRPPVQPIPQPQKPPSSIKHSYIDYKNDIVKLMKKKFNQSKINSQSLEKINVFLNVIAIAVLDEAYSSMKYGEISAGEIQDVLQDIFSLTHYKAILYYVFRPMLVLEKLEGKSLSLEEKQIKSGIQFPIKLSSGFFKKYNTHFTEGAQLYIAGLLECMTNELFKVVFASRRPGKELSIQEIELPLQQDDDFSELLIDLSIDYNFNFMT